MDNEAFRRSTSVYLVDRVCPMLPENLSNNLCSLNPNEDKYTFGAIFEFNKEFKIVNEWIGKTIIHSDRRFTYEEAQERIETAEGDFAAEINMLNTIALKLREERFNKGSISFESEEVQFILDENKMPIGMYVRERKAAHMLVEDFMLLANKQVATYIYNKAKPEIPFVYRIHDLPNPDKLADFALFAAELGFRFKMDKPEQIAESFNRLAEASKEDQKLRMLEPLAIRTMAKAEYSTNNIGHYGLGFQYYTHFTSPIRRYSDVLVHRTLFKNLDGNISREDKEGLEKKAKHVSEMERKANDAERESVKYMQTVYIAKFIGQTFDGIISGIIEKGVFVELLDSKVEGLVTFESMGEIYTVPTSRLKAKSRLSGVELTMGQSVKVKIIAADPETKRTDMELVMED
ncbi:MAG: RNB domain-containing ribonuclease [Saprospiraceae bacterium]|nr:RNB domain-containing ribonuclease [Saprospiraceae bacterium]